MYIFLTQILPNFRLNFIIFKIWIRFFVDFTVKIATHFDINYNFFSYISGGTLEHFDLEFFKRICDSRPQSNYRDSFTFVFHHHKVIIFAFFILGMTHQRKREGNFVENQISILFWNGKHSKDPRIDKLLEQKCAIKFFSIFNFRPNGKWNSTSNFGP